MKEPLTLGSLFDGISGFPLAGIYAGMKPVWASEIEPFPIRVATKRLPYMKQLGDIKALDGGEIEPVDVITFGSPCQNLSCASAKRTGLQGEKSSLFFEAVRIIAEMRKKTNGQYPKWGVWENVPGALSSAGGHDFRQVLESLARIKDPDAVVPMPDNGRWLSAGEIMGDTYSLAWRILDAQLCEASHNCAYAQSAIMERNARQGVKTGVPYRANLCIIFGSDACTSKRLEPCE